jgi:hypothetical protein
VRSDPASLLRAHGTPAMAPARAATAGQAPCRTAAADCGYRFDEAEFVYWRLRADRRLFAPNGGS